jgi:hypothetical protein
VTYCKAIDGGEIALLQTDALRIADFDGAKLESRSGLAVWPYADDQFGGTSDVKVTLIRPGARASRGALHVAYRVTDDWATPFAGVWMIVGKEAQSTDLTAYRGIRFFARSKNGGAFAAGIIQFRGILRRYFAEFETTSDWTQVELPFEKFKLSGPPPGSPANTASIDGKDITSIGVSVAPQRRGQFELDIDEIECYR